MMKHLMKGRKKGTKGSFTGPKQHGKLKLKGDPHQKGTFKSGSK